MFKVPVGSGRRKQLPQIAIWAWIGWNWLQTKLTGMGTDVVACMTNFWSFPFCDTRR